MDNAALADKFRTAFELAYSPVSVRILNDLIEEKTDTEPMRFCEMVRRSAVDGERFVISGDYLTCTSGELALGFVEPTYGAVYPIIKPAATELVCIEPLEETSEHPDVVLIVSNARKIMRIVTITSMLKDRQFIEPKFKGEMAVCGEGVAMPYMEKVINISLLCEGARMFSGYEDDEIVMGFPFFDFTYITRRLNEKGKISTIDGFLKEEDNGVDECVSGDCQIGLRTIIDIDKIEAKA